jgi:hypothetical protein
MSSLLYEKTALIWEIIHLHCSSNVQIIDASQRFRPTNSIWGEGGMSGTGQLVRQLPAPFLNPAAWSRNNQQCLLERQGSDMAKIHMTLLGS